MTAWVRSPLFGVTRVIGWLDEEECDTRDASPKSTVVKEETKAPMNELPAENEPVSELLISAKKETGPKPSDEAMSDYERQRLENIQRNKQMLASLKLVGACDIMKKSKQAAKTKRKLADVEEAPMERRRSSRIRLEKPKPLEDDDDAPLVAKSESKKITYVDVLIFISGERAQETFSSRPAPARFSGPSLGVKLVGAGSGSTQRTHEV